MSCGYVVIRVMRPFCLRLCDLSQFCVISGVDNHHRVINLGEDKEA